MVEGAEGCSRLCECGVSTCINPEHQPWVCNCGHNRASHHPVTYWLIDPQYSHPHACRVIDCGCAGLDFSLALVTIKEAIAALRCIQSDTQ